MNRYLPLILLLLAGILPSGVDAAPVKPEETGSYSMRVSDEKLIAWFKARDFAQIDGYFRSNMLKRSIAGSSTGNAVLENLFTPDRMGELEWVRPALDEWVEKKPPSSLAFSVRGEFFRRLGWRYRGEDAANKLSPEARQKFAENLELAAADASQALKIDSKNYYALLCLQVIATEAAGDAATAKRYFDRAIEVDRGLIDPYLTMLRALDPRWGGDARSMLEFARKSAAGAPADSALVALPGYAHSNLADASRDKRRYFSDPAVWKETRQSFEEASRRFPRTSVYAGTLAVAAQGAGDIKTADEQFHAAQERDPTRGDLHYFYGVFLETEKNDSAAAMREYDTALQLNPSDKRSLQRRGHLKSQQGQPESAYVDFAKEQAVNPHDGWGSYGKATSLEDRGDLTGALAEYVEATKQNPKEAKFWRKRCYVQVGLKNYESAVSDCTRAIDLDPNDVTAVNNRAFAYERLGKMQESAKDQARALQLKH